LHRYTPPDTRETTMHRPVSWLATWGRLIRVGRMTEAVNQSL
jgi:hypothetical protein